MNDLKELNNLSDKLQKLNNMLDKKKKKKKIKKIIKKKENSLVMENNGKTFSLYRDYSKNHNFLNLKR
jgi:hypothetical protein